MHIHTYRLRITSICRLLPHTILKATGIVLKMFMFLCLLCCDSLFCFSSILCNIMYTWFRWRQETKPHMIIVSFHRKKDCLLLSCDFRHTTFLLQRLTLTQLPLVLLLLFLVWLRKWLCSWLTYHNFFPYFPCYYALLFPPWHHNKMIIQRYASSKFLTLILI